MQADLPYLLPEAALHRLTGLVHLALRGFLEGRGGDLEVPLARITPYLTHLDLSENGFSSIPSAVVGLERLQHLNLSMCPLQLRQQRLGILTSLSKLRTLELRKEGWYQGSGHSSDSGYHTWDRKSRELVNILLEKLPELDVQIGLLGGDGVLLPL